MMNCLRHIVVSIRASGSLDASTQFVIVWLCFSITHWRCIIYVDVNMVSRNVTQLFNNSMVMVKSKIYTNQLNITNRHSFIDCYLLLCIISDIAISTSHRCLPRMYVRSNHRLWSQQKMYRWHLRCVCYDVGLLVGWRQTNIVRYRSIVRQWWVENSRILCICPNVQHFVYSFRFDAAFSDCANDPFCAAQAIQGYMNKYAQVSNVIWRHDSNELNQINRLNIQLGL